MGQGARDRRRALREQPVRRRCTPPCVLHQGLRPHGRPRYPTERPLQLLGRRPVCLRRRLWLGPAAMSAGHSHGHSSATDFGRAFAIGIGLNLGFVIVETIYGFIAGSMALIADAGHNLSDVLGLVVAWAGARMARTSPTRHFTYGLKKASIL